MKLPICRSSTSAAVGPMASMTRARSLTSKQTRWAAEPSRAATSSSRVPVCTKPRWLQSPVSSSVTVAQRSDCRRLNSAFSCTEIRWALLRPWPRRSSDSSRRMRASSPSMTATRSCPPSSAWRARNAPCSTDCMDCDAEAACIGDLPGQSVALGPKHNAGPVAPRRRSPLIRRRLKADCWVGKSLHRSRHGCHEILTGYRVFVMAPGQLKDGAPAISGGPDKLELERGPRLSPRALGSGGARDGRLELSTGLFYMSAHQALRLLAIAPGPGPINRMVLARGSRDPTGRLQVQAHVALREGMKPIEHLARHRVETWHDECEMERAVEISRHRELPGRERRVERLKGRGRRLAFGGRRSAGALGGAARLDVEAQAEHLRHFRSRERPNLKSAIGEDVDQALGAQLEQRLAHRDLAGTELGRDRVLQELRPGRVDAREDLLADADSDLPADGARQRLRGGAPGRGARGRGAHGRMPQQKGSSGSSRNLASPVTWAAPVMVGVISPRSRA